MAEIKDLDPTQQETIAKLRVVFPEVSNEQKDDPSFIKKIAKQLASSKNFIPIHNLGIPFRRVRKISGLLNNENGRRRNSVSGASVTSDFNFSD